MATLDPERRRRLEREAEQGEGFAQRMRARGELFLHGLAEDPWADGALLRELDRCAARGVAQALADAGRALLASDRLSELLAWLPSLQAAAPADREALAVVQGLLAVRLGDNARVAEELQGIPHPEAVALHGLALLQLRRAADAAARLEVLLAADALDERGELEPTYLPGALPVLALFLTACQDAAESALRLGRVEEASPYALAAGGALRRYARAPAVDRPTREAIARLVERCKPKP